MYLMPVSKAGPLRIAGSVLVEEGVFECLFRGQTDTTKVLLDSLNVFTGLGDATGIVSGLYILYKFAVN